MRLAATTLRPIVAASATFFLMSAAPSEPTIVDYEQVSGVRHVPAPPDTWSPTWWQETLFPNAGTHVADMNIWAHRQQVAPVPEPASLTLLAFGLASVGVRRLRQRKA